MRALTWTWLVAVIPLVSGLNEFRTWSNASICEKAQNVNFPYAYSKYSTQLVENKGRVNSNLQDFRHECQTRGGLSKCHICETIACSSDIGTCELQLQGVNSADMSSNIPTVSDIAWAIGGNYRSDYGGSTVTHYCVFLSGGDCILPTSTDFSTCAVRCFGYGNTFPARNQTAAAPILIEPDFTPPVDTEMTDVWTYPRNCSELMALGLPCDQINSSPRTPTPLLNPQGFTFTVAGLSTPGFADGDNNTAKFFGPEDVAVDNLGYIYVADTLNNAIRYISPDGWVGTIAGAGPNITGYRDGNCSYALFSHPKAVDVVRVGDLVTIIVADTGNHRIRQIDIDNSTSTCTVSCVSGLCYDPAIATNPYYNQVTPLAGYTDGLPFDARYSSPQDLTFFDFGGNSYIVVADTGNFLIRIINMTNHNVSTLAGNTGLDPSGVPVAGCISPCLVGIAGKRDGNLSYAQFYTPQSVSVGVNNTIYVADEHRIRLIELPTTITELYGIQSSGRVSTIAGVTVQGIEDGRGEESSFYNPSSIFVTAENIAYVTDAASCRIRRVAPAPLVAQSITCSMRLVDVIRPSGCTSYDQTIDETSRKISRVEANLVYNYGDPYVTDVDRGKYIKNCLGSPPVSTLDKHFLNITGDNLVVDDYRVAVNEDSELGMAVLVYCSADCASDVSILEGDGGFYSDISSICKAGIHSGQLNSTGLLLAVVHRINATFAASLSGSVSNGVTSSALQPVEQRVFTVEFYQDSVSFVHTGAGHPAAKLEDGCGYYDAQPPTLAYFNSPVGIAAIKNSTISDTNFLYVADTGNHRIRGISATCTQICENGARCMGPDTCTCLPGWSGVDCTSPICSIACGTNNVCVGPDTCACKPGFTGSSCTTPQCAQTCHNGGSCSSPDTCSCLSGWFDSNCTTPVCSQTCGNGGNCTAPSTCTCPADWQGTDCRIPVCSMPCLNGGICIAPDTCHCPPQYIGANCSLPVCTQGYFVPNQPILATHLYSTNNLRRKVYRPCDIKQWCVSTNEFECDQLDITYEELEVPSGPYFRFKTGRKFPPPRCLQIELLLAYKIPFQLVNADNTTTPYMRYTPYTPYLSNDSNPWRGFNYSSGIYGGHTGPWTYTPDRQIAYVEYLSMSDGVYACANEGNCTAPDTCECAPGWVGFDCRTPVCTQGYYHPYQPRFVSGLETYSELDDFAGFMTSPVQARLRWMYSNPEYEVDYEYYTNISTVIRQFRLEGNLTYLGLADWSTGQRVSTSQGGYRCSVRAMTQWENLLFILDHPNYYSRYMDMTVQLDGNTYTTWNNMHWPPVHSHSKQLDQVLFNITFAYTDEGYRRLGIWSRVAGINWEYGTCLMEFSRTCSDSAKTLDLLSELTGVAVQDTDHSFRPNITYNDFNVSSRGRWRALGGECVDQVLRGCFNNGTCVSPGACACASGWSGGDCSIPLCRQTCQHHGNCTLPDTCTCEKGWSGFDCSIAVCAQECQNGGYCVAPDTCECIQWANEFRDGRLGGGRPLYRKSNGDPQNTGWTGFDCSVPICVQAQAFIFNVPNASSAGYEVLGGHGGDNLLKCNDSSGAPVPRCVQYDKKVTANDGRSFYTGCGYDPIDTGCCVIYNTVQVDCYQCPAASVISTPHSFACSSALTVLSGFTSQLSRFINFLDANGNFKICGKYHIPRRFNDIIGLTDYGTAVYYQNPSETDTKWSSQNYKSNLTSDRFLCHQQYWTQGDYIDDAGLSLLDGAGTHFGLTYGRQLRTNDPNYLISSTDITGTLYYEGPKIPGEGIFECYNHGSCLGPDVCSCADGWDGFDCATPLCRHLQPSGFISGCLNGGICQGKDDCKCIRTSSVLWEVYDKAVKGLTGWTGTDCSIPICSQGFFDPFCTDLPEAPAGEGCFRCSNGGNCTAPDACTCADGWTGFDCRTPVCQVVADPLTRTQLNTIFEDKIVSFESDPCGVVAIYGHTNWNGIPHTAGNCTQPNECTCLCTMRYDKSLCKSVTTDPSTPIEHCRGPWQDPMIQVRDILSTRGPQFIFGTKDCERGFEGNVNKLDRFTTCHQIIYTPTYLERFSVNIIIGVVLGLLFGLFIFYFIRRRWKRQLLLEKIERRKNQRGDEEEDYLLEGSNV